MTNHGRVDEYWQKQVAAFLRRLNARPLLATELPNGMSNAIAVAEETELAVATKLSEGTTTVPSAWRWEITDAGREWLGKQNPKEMK